MKPYNFQIDTSGMSAQLVGTLHKAELEFAAVLVIRYHHVHKLEAWTPISRRDVATLFESDTEGAMKWGKNPFWRPDPYGFFEQGYITGWGEGPDVKGLLTQKFFDAVEVVQAELRGGPILTHDTESRRSFRMCRCNKCGLEAICTPENDFYTRAGDSTKALYCETCVTLPVDS
jgi:hypothetical protein